MRRIKPKLVNLDKFYEGLLAMNGFNDVPYDDLRELIAKSEVDAYYPDEVIAILEDVNYAIERFQFQSTCDEDYFKNVQHKIQKRINALKGADNDNTD